MTKEQLEALGNSISAEWGRRKRLGGYSTDAEAILKLCEWMGLIVQHLSENSADEK